MNVDKEVLALWKEVSPGSAFSAGFKECAGRVWVRSHQNVKAALAKIARLRQKADPVAQKFLTSMEHGIVWEEPHNPPGEVMGVFFNHLMIEGVNEKHVLSLAEQCVSFLGVQQDLWERSWPIELQIFSAQSCDGASALLETIKRQCGNEETKQAITALQARLVLWKKNTCSVKLKRNDFAEIFPLLRKKSMGLGRKKSYPAVLRDWYDYLESPKDIERLAVSWIDAEKAAFKKSCQKLAKRYKCKASVEEINKALEKHQHIPLNELLRTTNELRRAFQKLAVKEWVKITPKYDVRVIETPKYLVPFLPTAAMQPFGQFGKPFCISFVTTDKSASPSTFLPGVAQTLIHEEYGHCVNFMNSYANKKLREVEIIDSSLSTPLTEGLSFYRELESLETFRQMVKSGPRDKVERDVIRLIEKFCPFADFVDGVEFEVLQWRMVRFLRAVSDVRINLEKQTFPEFVEWAHKKTGLSKKLIFDQTFHFQKNPGYAPCYSVFGQRLRGLQKRAMKKGVSQVEFNTFVASAGFPARSIFERQLSKTFRI